MPAKQDSSKKKELKAKAATKKTTKKQDTKSNLSSSKPKKIKSESKTRIFVQYDVGYKNSLYLRGTGIPNLNWEQGLELKNVKNDEWVFEIDQPFTKAEFKILINDKVFELGDNHNIVKGSSMRINPQFPVT